MTVKNLINELINLPQDADVFVQSPTGGWHEATNAKIEDDTNDKIVLIL